MSRTKNQKQSQLEFAVNWTWSGRRPPLLAKNVSSSTFAKCSNFEDVYREGLAFTDCKDCAKSVLELRKMKGIYSHWLPTVYLKDTRSFHIASLKTRSRPIWHFRPPQMLSQSGAEFEVKPSDVTSILQTKTKCQADNSCVSPLVLRRNWGEIEHATIRFQF